MRSTATRSRARLSNFLLPALRRRNLERCAGQRSPSSFDFPVPGLARDRMEQNDRYVAFRLGLPTQFEQVSGMHPDLRMNVMLHFDANEDGYV